MKHQNKKSPFWVEKMVCIKLPLPTCSCTPTFVWHCESGFESATNKSTNNLVYTVTPASLQNTLHHLPISNEGCTNRLSPHVLYYFGTDPARWARTRCVSRQQQEQRSIFRETTAPSRINKDRRNTPWTSWVGVKSLGITSSGAAAKTRELFMFGN